MIASIVKTNIKKSHGSVDIFNKQVQCARSTVIAMAIFNGRLSIEEGLKASRVEERSQQDEWGFVEGAHDVSHTDLSLRMLGAGLYLQTLKM